MYDLNLSAEQIEFRDTVKDFVDNEVRPTAILPSRLEPFEKPLLTELLEYVSRMGLRTLSLSEAAGGAGADALTSCIVLEELAAGDVDIAMALGLTQGLARALFEEVMSQEQRDRFLPDFLEDHQYHLAYAGLAAGSGPGWSYHRNEGADTGPELTAVKQKNGEWIVSGTLPFVPNAPIAKLLVVQARTDAKKSGRNGLSTFVIPRGTAGLAVAETQHQTDGAGAQLYARWYHGCGAEVRFENCRVPGENLVGAEGQSPLATGAYDARATTQIAAINLGLGRCAYEAAVDYAKIRVQGGRPIIEHQAIGTILADIAIKLELSRNAIWKAAWASDHPDSVQSVSALPLHTIARVYTAEAMHEATLGAAECFGAMGVMRDMPLQKYVHDAHVFLYGADHDSATKLEIAESVSGFEREAA